MGVLLILPYHPVLGLYVGFQEPRRQGCITIWAAEFMVDPFQVALSLPRHLESVGLCRVVPRRVAYLTSHDLHIGRIGTESHKVKQLRQGVKRSLKVGCLSRRNNPTASIKICCQPLHVPPETLRASRAWVHRLLR